LYVTGNIQVKRQRKNRSDSTSGVMFFRGSTVPRKQAHAVGNTEFMFKRLVCGRILDERRDDARSECFVAML